MSTTSPDTSHPYQPPLWANVLKNKPQHGRLHLANLPTPLHLINTKSSRRRDINKDDILSKLDELNIKLYIKRDDATGKSALILFRHIQFQYEVSVIWILYLNLTCLHCLKPHILTEVISSS